MALATHPVIPSANGADGVAEIEAQEGKIRAKMKSQVLAARVMGQSDASELANLEISWGSVDGVDVLSFFDSLIDHQIAVSTP